MKQFISFVKKEFRHILRDKRTMLILLVMPVLQIIIFGFAITAEVKNVKIGIVDPSNDISTSRITEQLGASEFFHITNVFTNKTDLDNAFKKGDINLAVIFSENFNENLIHTGNASIQLIADATDPNQATLQTVYAAGIIGSYQQELLQQYKIPFRITPEVRMLYNPQMKSAYFFVPGVMGLILILICAMMTSLSIVREKELGTMEVLLVSPMQPVFIILAKAVPYFTLSFVNLCSILLLSVFLLGVPISGSLFWLIIVSLIFIIVALALGLMISTLVNNQVSAMLASGMGLMMPVMILSGMIFPIESMPDILQWISNIIPARWYIAAIKKLMIEGLGVRYVLKELIILTGMALVLITVSLRNFKVRLQ